ncbi:hypothetical protein ACOMHN_037352 [Nucella lapillus]
MCPPHLETPTATDWLHQHQNGWMEGQACWLAAYFSICMSSDTGPEALNVTTSITSDKEVKIKCQPRLLLHQVATSMLPKQNLENHRAS